MQPQKNIIFLTSSLVNLAKLFAINNRNYDVFLLYDRRFPFELGEDEIDNFYTFVFEKSKLYEKNKEQYFDTLAVFITDFEPDLIITNNFTKLLPKSFIEFFKFRNKNMKILNLHNADLRILENIKNPKIFRQSETSSDNNKKYVGLYAERRQFLDEEQIITTLHLIEDEKMDEGTQLAHSHPTTLKELKIKKLVRSIDEILNLRMRNVILSYHQRTKVLNLLSKVVEQLME